jgi:hypothetical protein
MTDEATAATKPVTVSAWKKASTHYPLLPSGVRVGIRIPDLPAMIEAGQIPQHLLDAALGMAGDDGPTKESIIQQREFTDTIVQLTVVEPKLSEEDVREIPYEDKDFLVRVATRMRDFDAEGEHLAGLNRSEKFRRFRQIGEFSPDLEGA